MTRKGWGSYALALALGAWATAPAGVPARPWLRVDWRVPVFSLGKVEGTSSLSFPPQQKNGITLTFTGGTLSHHVNDLKLDGNVLSMRDFDVTLRFQRIDAKATIVMSLPQFTVRTERRETKIFGKRVVYDVPVTQKSMKQERKEISTKLDRPGIIAEAGPSPERLNVKLPRKMRFLLVPAAGRWGFTLEPAGATFALELSRAIDAGLSDAVLAPRVKFRPDNTPKMIEGAIRSMIDKEKPRFFAALRDSLKKEIAAGKVTRELEKVVAKELPAEAIRGGKIPLTFFLPERSGQTATIVLGDGGDQAAELSAQSSLEVAGNEPALGLILSRYFAMKAAMGPKPPWQLDTARENAFYSPTRSIDWKIWEGLLSELSGANVGGREIERLGFVMRGRGAPALSFAGERGARTLVLDMTLLAVSRRPTDPMLRMPVAFVFGVGPDGKLSLVKILAREKRREAHPSLLPGGTLAETSFRLNLLAVLGNEELKKGQSSQGAVRYRIDESGENDPRLVVTLTASGRN